MRRIATIFFVLFWIIWMLGSAAVERDRKASGVLENSSTAAASSPTKPKSTNLKQGVTEDGAKAPGAEGQKKGAVEIAASVCTAVLSIMVSFVLCVLFVAYVGWGEVLRRKGRRRQSQQKRREEKFREAISLCKRAIEFDPLDSWAWKSWGATLMEMGRPRTAIQKFRKAVAANPRDSSALTN